MIWGRTDEEREKRKNDKYKPHIRFVWWPVRLKDGRCALMQRLWCTWRRLPASGIDYPLGVWEYTPLIGDRPEDRPKQTIRLVN